MKLPDMLNRIFVRSWLRASPESEYDFARNFGRSEFWATVAFVQSLAYFVLAICNFAAQSPFSLPRPEFRALVVPLGLILGAGIILFGSIQFSKDRGRLAGVTVLLGLGAAATLVLRHCVPLLLHPGEGRTDFFGADAGVLGVAGIMLGGWTALCAIMLIDVLRKE
jgi:hypothetical protein